MVTSYPSALDGAYSSMELFCIVKYVADDVDVYLQNGTIVFYYKFAFFKYKQNIHFTIIIEVDSNELSSTINNNDYFNDV